MKNIIATFVRSLPIFFCLVVIGYIVAHLLLVSPTKLDFTLFALGSISIVIILPSVFFQSENGALHTPKVIFRKVDTLESRSATAPESVFSALGCVIAGVLTWIYSFFYFLTSLQFLGKSY